MPISLQQVLEEGAGCCQDHLVCLHLMAILTDQGHISKVVLFPKTFKSCNSVFFEIITFDFEILGHSASTAALLGDRKE